MDVLITKAVETLILPPGFNVVAMLLGLFLLRRCRRSAMTLILLAGVSLYVLSLPWMARILISTLETYPPLTIGAVKSSNAAVIVVLGAGIYADSPEYGGDALSAGALPRLRYGAYLHRFTQLPILVTGGRVFGEGISEGELMQEFLQQDLNINVEYVEGQALNTAENALYSQQMLAPHGIDSVIVVTHAWHMPRAVAAFEREGLVVLAGPIEYRAPILGLPGVLGWLPNLSALGGTTLALREYLGRAWYALRY